MSLVMSLLQHWFMPLLRIIFSMYNRLTRSHKYDRREPLETHDRQQFEVLKLLLLICLFEITYEKTKVH